MQEPPDTKPDEARHILEECARVLKRTALLELPNWQLTPSGTRETETANRQPSLLDGHDAAKA